MSQDKRNSETKKVSNLRRLFVSACILVIVSLSVVFVVYQRAVNKDAKLIVEHNTQVEHQAQLIYLDLIHNVQKILTAPINSPEEYIKQYQSGMKKEYSKVIELKKLTGQMKTGNNLPSQNHYNKVASVINNYVNTASDLPVYFETRLCMYNLYTQYSTIYTHIQKQAENLIVHTTYDETAAALEFIVNEFSRLRNHAVTSTTCFENVSSSLQEELSEVIQQDDQSIQNYINSYLVPLKNAYITKDDQAIQSLLQAPQNISLLFQALFVIPPDSEFTPIDSLLLSELSI